MIPDPLAITLIVILLGIIAVSGLMILFEVIRWLMDRRP